MRLYVFIRKCKSGIYRLIGEPIVKRALASCGKNVRVLRSCSFSGVENIYVGSRVAFGVNNSILSTRAKVIIGNDVMMGPGVTIITGNHRTDIVGRTMMSIKDSEKLPENDEDVVIENDVWIGANVTILKGVTIHQGSIVAAGAVVTHDIPPYQIWGGVSAHYIADRFSKDELQKHKEILGIM